MKILLFYYWSIFLLFFNVSIEGSSILNFFSRPKPALELPEDIIKVIALHCLKDDIKSVSLYGLKDNSEYDLKDDSRNIFHEYSYFLKKGFLKKSQSFNQLLLINKSFSKAALNITYEDKLDVWFEERIIIPDLFFERILFSQLINEKDPFNENDQKYVTSCALKFFAHPDFFDALYRFGQYKALYKALFFDCIMPRGVYTGGIARGVLNNRYRQSLLMEIPHVFFIFYRNMQLNYMHKPVNLVERYKCNAYSFIKSNTPFLHNDNFDMDWFEHFLALSSDLFNYRLSKESFGLTENLKRHKERLVNSEMTGPLKELFVKLIDCYSELNVQLEFQLETKWYNKDLLKQLNDDQKIMWFYYTHSIHLAILCNSQYSFVFVQDLLFEIQKWLQDTYPDTAFIVTDELFAKFKTYPPKFLIKIFRLLDYVVKDANTDKIFDPNLVFKALRTFVIFNQSLIKKKRDKSISKESFYSDMAKQLFEDTSNPMAHIVKIQRYIRKYNLLIEEEKKVLEQFQDQILESNNSGEEKDIVDRVTPKKFNFFNRIKLYKKHFFMGAVLLISGIVFYLSRITYFRLIK